MPVDSRVGPAGGRSSRPLGNPGEDLHPAVGDPDRVQPGHAAPRRAIFTTWSFRTTELRSTAWVSQRMPSATVKTGFRSSCSLVLADEERGDLPGRQVQREPLHELLELRGRRLSGAGCARTSDRNESTTTTPGCRRSTSVDDPRQDVVEVAVQRLLAEVEEVHVGRGD